MTALAWDQSGSRLYEIGLDRGVLYKSDGTGVAWSGLVSVDEDFSEDQTTPLYIDGVKYLDREVVGDFMATLNALTYPKEFLEYEGVYEMDTSTPGVFIDGQRSKTFGLSYRTLVGSDVLGTDLGYQIHILYNLTAVPDDMTHATLNDGVTLDAFSWKITALPERAEGYRPTSHIIIDSRFYDIHSLEKVENILYGTDDDSPRIPTIQELLDIVLILITDNGDGTWTATGPDDLITFLDPDDTDILDGGTPDSIDDDTIDGGTPDSTDDDVIDGGGVVGGNTEFQIANVDGEYLDADTYNIRTTY